MKIEFFKKKNKFVKKDSETRADFYWKYILLFTFILIAISFVFSFYLFMDINKSSDLSMENVNEKDIIEKDNINATLRYFDEKEKKSEMILNSPVLVVDPSL